MTKSTRNLASLLAIGSVMALAAILLRPHEAAQGAPTTREAAGREKGKGKSGEQKVGDRKAAGAPASPLLFSTAPLLLVGSVVSETQASLSVRVPARIVALYVREGQRVHKGQLLAQLDASDLQTQLDTALAAVTTAKSQVRKAALGQDAQSTKADADVANAHAGLNQARTKRDQALLAYNAAREETRSDLVTAREGVRKAQAALDRAQQTLKDLQGLAEVGGVSRSDLEGAQTQVTIAEADLVTAQTQERRLNTSPGGDGEAARVALARKDYESAQEGARQAQAGLALALRARGETLSLAEQDVRAAQAQQAQAQTGVSGAQNALAQARLVSPLEGIVSQVAAHTGETAQPGASLLTLVSLSGPHIEALAPARQLARMHVGQTATITVDTQPGARIFAVVSAIASVAEPDGRSFRVTFRLASPHPLLRPGQTAHITIVQGR